MPKPEIVKTFRAILKRSGNSLNWTVVELPFDVQRVWGTRGQLRVKGTIHDFAFRTTLFPDGRGHHFLIVNKPMQKGGRVQPGMEAQFVLRPDLEEHVVPVSPELERVLKQSSRLRKFYQSFPPSTRRDIARVISEAKQAETRKRRAEQFAERLMETMEAEIDLPPMIRQAFARNLAAAAGWQRMPRSHRRRHLLGIFYYRNLDSRLRRLEKALTEMMEYAKRAK